MSFDILRILVVDPNGDISNSIRSKFNNVYSCNNAREAMLLSKQISPDCIVCDYDVNDQFLDIKNGVDLFVSFESEGSAAAKILVSSSEDFYKIQKAINQGGILKLIQKPFKDDDFIEPIKSSFEYIELLRENSGLISRASARKQYLTNLKSVLENKQKEQTETIKASDIKVKDIKAEYELINSLIISIQSADSIEELEGIIVDQLYEPMGVDYVKIILDQETLPEEMPNIISTHLFCSGANLGYIKFGRGVRGGDPSFFTANEVDLLDRVSDIVAMIADKIVRFSKLKKLKTEWDSVFNSIEEPLVVINRGFEIVQANKSFEKLSGTEGKVLLGSKCYSTLVDGGSSCCCDGCNVSTIFETGKPSGSKVRFDKIKKNYTTWAYPIFEGKEINCVVQFYKDISEETTYREKILYSEKMAEIGIIAGSVAHEINNPIGGILAFLQMMMSETDKTLPLYEDLAEMEKAAKRCKQIADNLLHFSRQSKDEEVKEIEVSAVLSTLIPLVQLQIRHENISINLNDKTAGLFAKGVFNELVQAFLNIVNTSVELIQKKGGDGFVNIDVFQENADLIISVYDNGYKFIDDEDFQNLALFVTKKIIKEHNGNINIGHRTDADGNYYRVSLPIVFKETL